MLGYVGPILGSCRAHVGPMLAYVGPMLAHVQTSWELCWGHVWAIYVETILRCQFLRPGPPPGAQNHVKTEVFQHCQDEIPCRRRARNTVKTQCFFNTASKIHHKLQGHQSTRSPAEVNTGWVGGRVGSPYNPARGPLAVSLPYGSSLLSVGERGRAPCRRRPCVVFCARPLFSNFSAFVAQDASTWANIGRKMGQHGPKMGQHSPQDGPG